MKEIGFRVSNSSDKLEDIMSVEVELRSLLVRVMEMKLEELKKQ